MRHLIHDPKILSEAIMMISLSAMLHYVKLFSLPQGGSVTLGSMVPILLFALRRGVKPGIFAGFILGFVALIQNPFIYNPIQVFLDYPFAFASLGLSGVFVKNYSDSNLLKPILGIILAIFTRLFFHVISGIIFFSEFVPEGMNPIIYSLIYNGSFLGIELIISIIIMSIIIKRGTLSIYR
tara:strand:+ start:410 stop:952 length:543 start_codon:yes stop_codon:yes gene_type:complete